MNSILPSSFGVIPVVAILFPVFLLAVIFGFVILMRYMRYKEQLLWLERGIDPTDPRLDGNQVPELKRPSGRYRATMSASQRLRSGIITSLVGIALILGLLTLGVGPWLLGGLIPLAVGIGEILTVILLTPVQDDKDREL